MADFNCGCPSCKYIRERNEYSPYGDDFVSMPRPVAVPIELEPEAEPVYTHVLIDCYLDGGMMGDSAEPHTAESLLVAIETRAPQDGRYKVYKLGRLLLDVCDE